MKYFNNKIFIPISILVSQLVVGSTSLASFQWNVEPVDLTERREAVAYLTQQLEADGEDAKYVVKPNIAVASVTVHMKDIEDQNVKMEIALPYFFLSGWSRENYKHKIKKDIINFIHDHTYHKFKSFLSYQTSMLEDFYENIEGYKYHLKHAHGLQVDGLSEEQFNKKYLHSEQAIFLLCEAELPKIQAQLVQSLRPYPEIQRFEINILSYYPICIDCKGTAVSLEDSSQKILNTKAFFTFKFEEPISQISRENKRKSLEGRVEENEEKPLSPKKQKAEEGTKYPDSLTSKRVKEWDENKEIELENILSSLRYGGHNPSFIGYLIPVGKYPIFTSVKKILLEEHKPDTLTLNKLRVTINNDIKAKNSAYEPLCDILNAYTYIFIEGKIKKEKRVDIRDNMKKIIDSFKVKMQKEPAKQTKSIHEFFKKNTTDSSQSKPNSDQYIEPAEFIRAKIAEKLIELLP
jgi:hypothetical protein